MKSFLSLVYQNDILKGLRLSSDTIKVTLYDKKIIKRKNNNNVEK